MQKPVNNVHNRLELISVLAANSIKMLVSFMPISVLHTSNFLSKAC